MSSHELASTSIERHGTGPEDGGRITLADLNINPYPIYRELRQQGVVWVDAIARWLVTRWDDVSQVETGRDDFSSNETHSNLTRLVGYQMLRSDGRAHKRLRAAAQDPLRPPAVQARTDALQAIADRLIQSFADLGAADLIEAFAAPFAGYCLIEVLGLRDVGWRDVERWSQAIMAGSSNYADDREVWAFAHSAMAEIDRAVDAVIEAPVAGSIIEAMRAADGAVQPLTVDEVRANVKVIIGGGFNEPRDAIGTALWALLTHPEQLAAVLAMPSLWGQVVEETIRWVSPIGVAPREVVRSVRLADTELEPGARVMISFASANRDERHWDTPEAFDLSRSKSRNLAFGMGHHYCLGVWLSRAQLGAVALPALLTRLRGLRLDLDQPPAMRGWVFRGPVDLRATWHALSKSDRIA